MQRMLAALLLVAGLAGCIGDGGAPEAPAAQPVEMVSFSGRVLTPAFNPIAGANISLVNPVQSFDDGTDSLETTVISTTTDGEGAFTLLAFPGNRNLTVAAPEFETALRAVTLPSPNITVTLVPVNRVVPFQTELPFDGYIQCAFEAAIISPSCDSALTVTPVDPIFDDSSVFNIEFDDDWKTIVLDVYFNPAQHPGIDGMRVSAYAPDSDAEVFSYERITSGNGPEPFTLRLSPDTDYGDVLPTPEGAGGIRFEFYGHGHFTEESPALGFGTTTALEFEAIATIFYHEDAPEGWTKLP